MFVCMCVFEDTDTKCFREETGQEKDQQKGHTSQVCLKWGGVRAKLVPIPADGSWPLAALVPQGGEAWWVGDPCLLSQQDLT
jgi:hypothetical protein